MGWNLEARMFLQEHLASFILIPKIIFINTTLPTKGRNAVNSRIDALADEARKKALRGIKGVE